MEKIENAEKVQGVVISERLVLFADIMGFKDRVMRTQHEKLEKELLELTKWSRMKPLKLGDHLHYSQFSDSILVVTDKVGEQQANLITQAGVVLMQECLKRGFPLKGAIAQGKFTYDASKQLFFGQPLVDAYLLQESVKYYGIVLHHTAEDVMQNNPKTKQCYERLKVNIEHAKISHYQLCWHKVDQTMNFKNPCDWRSWLDNIERQVSGRPRIYVDNTRNILEEQEEQQEEQKKQQEEQKKQQQQQEKPSLLA